MEGNQKFEGFDQKLQFDIETRNMNMNSDLSDHLNKCRCCFATMEDGSQKWKINKALKAKFIEVSGIELKSSDLYSSIICNACITELDEGLKIRRKFNWNQMRLYKYVEEQEDMQGMDMHSDEDTKNFQTNLENIQTDLSNFSSDPFGLFNPVTGEVAVKEEKFDEFCVTEVKIPIMTQDFPQRHIEPKIRTKKLPKVKTPRPKRTPEQLAYRNVHKLCTICGANLSYGAYAGHMERHRNIMNNIYFYCDLCDYKAPTKKWMATHVYTHRSIESKPVLQCEKCPKVFFHRKRLNSHDKRMHREREPEEPVNCQLCGRLYKNKNSLSSHMKITHNSNKVKQEPKLKPKKEPVERVKKEKPEKSDTQIESSYPCEVCGKTYKTQIACKQHFDIKHAPKSPCEICGKMVGPGQAMHFHKVIHAEKVKCPFEGCGKLVATKGTLKKHILYRHNDGEPAKCDICGSEYKSVFKMKEHIRRHHLTPKLPCEVPGCNRFRSRPSCLIKHYRTHMDIDEFEKERLVQKVLEEQRKKWNLD